MDMQELLEHYGYNKVINECPNKLCDGSGTRVIKNSNRLVKCKCGRGIGSKDKFRVFKSSKS